MSQQTMLRYRSAHLRHVDVHVTTRNDGSMLVRSTTALQAYSDRLSDRLVYWAKHAPERTFMAKRDASGEWRRISYSEAFASARRIGQGLLNRGLSIEHPVAILSGNDLEHALLACACLYVGIPYAPVSPAYSLTATNFEKLHSVARILTPGLIFVSNEKPYSDALQTVFPKVEVTATNIAGAQRMITTFDELAETIATDEVDKAHESITGDTIAKLLFTSGSTGTPKAVINTNRMLCANLQMLCQVWPFIAEEPPVFIDWLPWHHTFGGNQNFGLTLYNGGTLYIDDGRPTPEGVAITLDNLKEISPTIYFNVPRGWDEISYALTRDEVLRDTYFKRLRMQFFAGASLAQPIWDRLDRVAEAHCGERIVMNTGLGMTETAPAAMLVFEEHARAGQIGLPVPGIELKLSPCLQDGYMKFEVRYRGPNVTPGYWRDEAQTKKSYDEEGFFCSGDAVKWLDQQHPQLGFLFDGRIAEDFKLDCGTWVSVGAIRESARSAGAPYLQDVVVLGSGRPEIALLLIPNIEECRRLAHTDAKATRRQILGHPSVRTFFQRVINEVNGTSMSRSRRIARALALETPLSLDNGEVTDKGSVNQRIVTARYESLINDLYAGDTEGTLFPTAFKQ